MHMRSCWAILLLISANSFATPLDVPEFSAARDYLVAPYPGTELVADQPGSSRLEAFEIASGRWVRLALNTIQDSELPEFLTAIPEPAGSALIGSGLILVSGFLKRRTRGRTSP